MKSVSLYRRKSGPWMVKSSRWKNWVTLITPSTCGTCIDLDGTIYPLNQPVPTPPPIHVNCRCRVLPMWSILAGTATKAGLNGADLYVKQNGTLPSNYITKKEAELRGWKFYLGNLAQVAPGKMVFQRYYNKDGRLPSKPGRIWYEADIDYTGGYRNTKRLLFSNDGLIFITYDHYLSFYCIE